MLFPGSRAIRPPRTAPPAFLSTLWCSLSCTMPSWIYSDGIALVLWLGSFSCSLSHGACCPLQVPAQFPRPLHRPALWLLRRHVLSLQCSLQSDSRTLPRGLEMSTAVTPARVCCGHPGPLAPGKFRPVLVFRRKQKRRYPFAHKSLCFQSLSKTKDSVALWMKSSGYWCMACGLPELHILGLFPNENQLKYISPWASLPSVPISRGTSALANFIPVCRFRSLETSSFCLFILNGFVIGFLWLSFFFLICEDQVQELKPNSDPP